MIQRQANNREGFTIIELLLAMTFVSILLLGIAMTVIQIGSIYNKGLTMKSVDQAGRALSDDIRRTLSQSQPFIVNTSSFYAGRLPATDRSALPDGGRLCTGLYTYVWNSGEALAKQKPLNEYVSASKATAQNDASAEIRFIRVQDGGGQYCADPSKQIDKTKSTELLATKGGDLAVQDFSITQLSPVDNPLGQALYRIKLVIGTNNQDALDTMDMTCRPPADDKSLQDFCAINRFDFTAQAGNKGGQ